MVSFLNKERYVKISDLTIGRPDTYTDYEELAMREGDPEWFDLLRSYVAGQWLHGQPEQEERDRCDVVFYTAVHVLSWWEGTDVTITEQLVSLAVETAGFMLVESLNTEWLIRSEDDWKDLADKERDIRVAKHRA